MVETTAFEIFLAQLYGPHATVESSMDYVDEGATGSVAAVSDQIEMEIDQVG